MFKFSPRACKADAVIVSFYNGKQEAHAFVDFMYNGKCHRARTYRSLDLKPDTIGWEMSFSLLIHVVSPKGDEK